ncbi:MULTISPECIES: CbiQ family ECF transporter T component [Bacteria]|uniref:CbiQ family ECF transporter T component n=1 Tax=Bacteria TaxID=2 RepID=UPI003C7CC9BA
MRPLFRPGSTVLHRIPAGVKLLVLAGIALALSFLPLGIVGSTAALIGTSVAYPATGQSWRALGCAWWRLRWLVLVLGTALLVFSSAEAAVVNTGRIVALLLLAELVTATTRLGELLEALRRLLAPTRRVGLDPDVVALTLSLTIAMIPVVGGIVGHVREAQTARGVRLGAGASVPVLSLTMRHADQVGEALVARGIVP